ncbi:MAG: hypothetical protein ABUL62_33030 [Myxococcales bacterium]
MASAKRDIRSIIDSFSDDLILIAQDIAREQVERAVAEWQAKAEKVMAKKSVQDEKALRNQKALERIERAAEKRRAREEQKAAERALRLEQRVIASLDKPEKKPRGRRSGLLAESVAKKEPVPPPLFVHKRRRDGEIQQLKRDDKEVSASSSSSNVASSSVASGNGSSSNGVSSGAPEQLLLGL